MKIGLFCIGLFSIFLSNCGEAEVKESMSQLISDEEFTASDEEIISSDIPDQEIKNTGINEFWNKLNPKKVKLFVYANSRSEGTNGDYSDIYIVNDKGILNKEIINSFTKNLIQDSIEYLIKLMSNTTNYWNSPADCFSPRHGIVFYNSKNKITGHISICFECNRYLSQPEVIHHLKIDLLKKIFKQQGLPTKDGEIRKFLKENPQ